MKVVPFSKQVMGYPLKVWGYSVLATTVLFIFRAATFSKTLKPGELWVLLPACLVLMLLFSFPACSLHLICYWKMLGVRTTEMKRKLLLILSGYICMIPSFFIFRIVFRMINFSPVAGNYLMLFMLITFTGWSLLLKTRFDQNERRSPSAKETGS